MFIQLAWTIHRHGDYDFTQLRLSFSVTRVLILTLLAYATSFSVSDLFRNVFALPVESLGFSQGRQFS